MLCGSNLDVFIENLKTQDQSQFFRLFKLNEVYQELTKLQSSLS